MAKPKIKLCPLCVRARDDRWHSNPTHLVHPVTKEYRLFDVRGEAECPICLARWRRDHTGAKLVE